MIDVRLSSPAHELVFESFGIALAVGAETAELLERVIELLPPGWRPSTSESVSLRLALTGDAPGRYGVSRDGSAPSGEIELYHALRLLEAQLQEYVALYAHERIFVHAGAVEHGGKAIVVPGFSLSGKTTLIRALVRAGATYYSDEFAVLDHEGLVHPYARRLSIRAEDLTQTEHSIESLGGIAGVRPIPVGLVVATTYRPGSLWEPRHLTSGQGVMAVLAHTVPARDRPEESLQTVSRALAGADVLEGPRGEADALAELLLEAAASPPAEARQHP